MERVFGFQPLHQMVRRNGETTGILPLFRVWGFRGSRLVSMPFRDRGGLVATTDEDAAELTNRARELAGQHSARYVVIKAGSALPPQAGFASVPLLTTTVTDLSPGAKALWQSLRNNATGPVRQARRSGLVVRCGTGHDDMECFRRIFTANRRALGVPVFPPAFFSGLLQLCDTGLARLLLAEENGTALAGMMLLLHGDTVIDGYAASLPQGKTLRANDLLVWNAQEWAADRGYARFEFGADFPDQKGLLAFKRKWAGEHLSLTHWISPSQLRDTLADQASDHSFALTRKVLSTLPGPVFNLLSRAVISRLG